MNTKHACILLLLFSWVVPSQAQDEQNYVNVEGIILDSETKEPVVARVFYESLPYGNKVGVFNNSVFSFRMEEGKSYAITIKADGYSSADKTYSPDLVVDGFIRDTLYLDPAFVGKLIRLESLIFGQADSKIPPTAYEELDRFVVLMNENPNMTIQLEGHTDYRGNAEKNMELSEKRVEATRDYLVEKGIDKKRISIVAFGGTKPIKKSNDPESYRLNRRVELRILQY